MIENSLDKASVPTSRISRYVLWLLLLAMLGEAAWLYLTGAASGGAAESDTASAIQPVGGTTWLIWKWLVLAVLTLAGVYWLHRLIRRIAVSDVRSRVVLQSIADAVIVTDAQGNADYLNLAAQQVLGISGQAAKGKPASQLLRLLHPETRQDIISPFERLAQAHASVRTNFPALLLTADGRELLVEDRSVVMKNEQGALAGVVVVLRDISMQLQAKQQIEELIYHDQLTGLPNRRLLQDRVENAISGTVRAQDGLALLLVDLDHFKVINDTLGHDMGDHILLIAGGRLVSCVADEDTVARVGGDEFVVMLTAVRDATQVALVAQKILAALSFPYRVDGADLHSTPSIGISLYPDDGADFGMLMKHADAAMYHAKESGRAAYRFYTQAMHERSLERLTIENNLYKALRNNEFELHYQPKVDLREGLLAGAEALVRWNHPELGMIPPAKFIPVAEESSIINAIGEWVLYRACRQIREWSDTGLKVMQISVNVSARQLMYGDLPGLLRQLIRDTGVNPQLVELELTESILMRPHEVGESLAECKALGFKLALDDFGTGYSSLSYLRRMAIDTLKIDRSFVSDLETNPDDVAIVQTIISMARNLRMNVIAEGVETSEQAGILLQSGCEYGQGYYFARPQTLEQFTALLQRSTGHASDAVAPSPQPATWLGQAPHLSAIRRHRYLL